jgi:anti-sigma regulatory factor (Ser/Thr protein kinase)
MSATESSYSMHDQLTLALRSSKAGLEEGRRQMRSFLEEHALGARAIQKVELVFEETVTNIIQHGFDALAEHTIEIRITLFAHEIEVVVDDEGRPFDPVAAPEPALPSSLEDAKVGGLGLLLVRRNAKHMAYARTAGRNRTTITIAR